MKAILTVAMMLGLLITFADAHPLGEKRSGGVITEQEEKNFKLCTQNLVAIGKAVEAYKKEHGNFPDWLSESSSEIFARCRHLPLSNRQVGWQANSYTQRRPEDAREL